MKQCGKVAPYQTLMSCSMTVQPHNPLHGIKLEKIINDLVEHFGWEHLGREISINCFRSDPSVKSSLSFLRKTPWARERVEKLYIYTFHTKKQRTKSFTHKK